MTITHRYTASETGSFTRFEIFTVMTRVVWSVGISVSEEHTSSGFRRRKTLGNEARVWCKVENILLSVYFDILCSSLPHYT
jgi:hypothetical protein